MILDRLRSQSHAAAAGYEPLAVDSALSDALSTAADRDAITVRPDKDNGGIDAMSDVLESLHSVETESRRLRTRVDNVSPAHAFELTYAAPRPGAERVVGLQYVPGRDGLVGAFRRQLQTRYPDSQIETESATFLDAHRGQSVAGAHLELRRYCLYPIKNVDLPGFRTDPTGSIIQEMVGLQEDAATDADVGVQILFKPARRTWTDGIADGTGCVDGVDSAFSGTPSITDLAYNLRQPSYERRRKVFTYEKLEKPPTTVDKKVAKLLEDQQGSKAWRLCLRVLAVSDDPDVAVARASAVAGQFRNFYESASEQTFVPHPRRGDALRQLVTDAATRTFVDRGLVKAEREVAGLVNIPEAQYIATNKLQWSLSSPGEGIPPKTPRFDYASHGVDAACSRDAKQLAMLDAADDDGPLWYGTGCRHGTEAGVFQDSLYHQFVGGATRQGKTTLLTNFASQTYRGSGGGLIIDPKGLDAEEFLAEWPTDRSVDDLVVMDLSDGVDQVPRFNFMEIPDYLEPGTRSHASYVEALAEDILAMVAEAGGSDNYLGALMKRVVKAVVRGLGKADQTATLLDVAVVCGSSQNLTRFRERMADERFAFLRDTAERLEERDDTDLEPLAGRLDEFVLNDNVRELICAREASFSINDLVSEGKWMVVRFDRASSATEIKMVGTALIRRTYFAQRHLEVDHSFDLVCDEFDKIASETSNIHSILSEAAAFDYRCTLACQAPTNQLPDRIRESISNQCGTFLSFNPGGGKDARWIAEQHTVDADDLLNLSRFRFYMRATTQDDQLTHSFKVEGFPPAREARGDARSDAEIQSLIERSLDRYGAAVETEAEQRAASPFIDSDGDAPREIDVTERVERAAVQAVYDTALRAGDAEGYVLVDAAASALRRRLTRLDETPPDVCDRLETPGDCWRRVIQHVRDEWLDVEAGEETRLRARNPRSVIATVGDNQSAGGAEHALLLWDAYHGLTEAGLDIDIADASGTDPDGLARAAPADEQAAPDIVDDLVGAGEARVEAESSTGRTKPGATVRHVCQAGAEGRQTIVLCRPDAEAQIRSVLDSSPALCRDDDEGRRFYTSPRDLRIDGQAMTRPGGRENVWRQLDSGEIVLEDAAGTEHARFDTVDAVFADADAYPTRGDVTIKRPVIPEWYEGETETTIVVVPEGATSLAELSIEARPEVPDRVRPLYEILCDELAVDETFTKGDAVDLAHANGLDRHYATIYDYVNELVDEGALTEQGEAANGAVALAVQR